jgi:hypothetical protein
VRIGSEFQVSSGLGYHGEAWSAVSAAPDGDFVVAWIQQDFHHNSPRARRYTREALPLGPELELAFSGDSVAVAHDPQGGYLISWDDSSDAGTTQAFGALGQPLGGPFEAVEPESNGRNVRIAFDDLSRPVFAWQRFVGSEANEEIDARLFLGASLLVDGFESGGLERWSASVP